MSRGGAAQGRVWRPSSSLYQTVPSGATSIAPTASLRYEWPTRSRRRRPGCRQRQTTPPRLSSHPLTVGCRVRLWDLPGRRSGPLKGGVMKRVLALLLLVVLGFGLMPGVGVRRCSGFDFWEGGGGGDRGILSRVSSSMWGGASGPASPAPTGGTRSGDCRRETTRWTSTPQMACTATPWTSSMWIQRGLGLWPSPQGWTRRGSTGYFRSWLDLGTVVDEGTGDPLEGIYVVSWCGAYGVGVFSQADGGYWIRVPAGDCSVGFYPQGPGGGTPSPYAGEWWNNRPTSGSADLVAVTAWVETSGIDAALSFAGSISGTVRDADGNPIEGVDVGVCDSGYWCQTCSRMPVGTTRSRGWRRGITG